MTSAARPAEALSPVSAAEAAILNFCGVVTPSNTGWGDPTGLCTGRVGYRFTLVSNTYYGGGNIDRIKARMAHYSPNRYFA